jgi:antitoxin component of RelBE/YafQ-DinJ toxin-antitoxin module
MKVLGTRIDGEVERKFKEKIQKEGLDASDVMRRLVYAYVGEPSDALKPLVDKAELDGRLSVVEDRLEDFNDKVEGKISKSVDGKCEDIDGKFEYVDSRFDVIIKDFCSIEEKVDDLNELIDGFDMKHRKFKEVVEDEISSKIITLALLIESVGNGNIKSNKYIQWCDDDIKGFKKLGVELQPFTLEHVKKE